jgi:hypothetical protein
MQAVAFMIAGPTDKMILYVQYDIIYMPSVWIPSQQRRWCRSRNRMFVETLGRISNPPLETLAQKQTKSSFSNPGNGGFSWSSGSDRSHDVIW